MEHVPSGAKVTSLRGTLEGAADLYGELTKVLAWLDEYQVTPGSIGSMAWRLFNYGYITRRPDRREFESLD